MTQSSIGNAGEETEPWNGKGSCVSMQRRNGRARHSGPHPTSAAPGAPTKLRCCGQQRALLIQSEVKSLEEETGLR